LVFEKNANFFRRKLAKIAENIENNIGPKFLLCTNISFAEGHRVSEQQKLAPKPVVPDWAKFRLLGKKCMANW
jgi:hypothetical protein